jgi:hypothetical protein
MKMKKYTTTTLVYLWIAQIIAAVILLNSVGAKLLGAQAAIELFNILMGQSGRYFIGILELLAAIQLLSNKYAAGGALLATAVMIGALIAHTTVLGISSILPALLVFILSVSIVYIRRNELPLVGSQM